MCVKVLGTGTLHYVFPNVTVYAENMVLFFVPARVCVCVHVACVCVRASVCVRSFFFFIQIYYVLVFWVVSCLKSEI